MDFQTPQNLAMTSQHFINSIESTIVLLCRALAIEQAKPIEDAQEIARIIIQDKINSLLPDKTVDTIKKISEQNNKIIKNRTLEDGEYPTWVYEILKTFGF